MLNRVQFHAAVSPHSTWSSLRAYLGSVFRVDGDDVPLQVLLKVVDIEHPKLLIPAYVASSGIQLDAMPCLFRRTSVIAPRTV